MLCHGVHFGRALCSQNDLNERRGNAVGSQQQRSNSERSEVFCSATRTICACSRDAHDCRKNAAVGAGVFTQTLRSVWICYCVSIASSRRVYGVCTVPTPNIIYSISPQGDHTELPQRSLRSHGAPTGSFCVYRAFIGRLQGADTAITAVRCEPTLPFTGAHKPPLCKCSTNSKFPTTIKFSSENMYQTINANP